MTDPTPEQPPLDPEQPNPTPDEPTPPEEEQPGEEEPPGDEQPPVPSDTPCTAVWPGDPSVVCEIQFDNHALFRIVHTSHANGTTYEWE
ncbi:hypothetical protein ACFZB4_18500 [Streptomyces pseudovenezuelae]|uniref:hypothetical protein n=1 Tax=Streptomyces pseudovenezuelae TaxID=67350 RepID=UPI0036E8DB0A